MLDGVSLDQLRTFIAAAEEGSFMSHHDGWARVQYLRWQESEHKGPFVDMNGNALDNGGGYITYCSHDYVYAPGGQGVLTGEGGERNVL